MPGKNDKPKVVLDTNVWLSAVFWHGKPEAVVKLAEAGSIRVLVSKQILEEIVNILHREEKKFGKFLNDYDNSIESLVRYMLSIAELVDVNKAVKFVLEDPADDKILECAASVKADYIVSGDNHLLKLGSFEGVEIVTPKRFLEKIRPGGDDRI
ncbi:MAG: putative toxin-antitoxin system toxin component, PIN family [Candidatus Aenigmarchaeota archaeon]|nr:putative toxin-antitoxin system toxin component, PIN family [Candidatus Aenigmarchaeota archaeon]